MMPAQDDNRPQPGGLRDRPAPPDPAVLYFGIYSRGPEYPRNNNLIASLRRLGVPVGEAHLTLQASFQERLRAASRPASALRFLLKLIASYGVLARKFLEAPAADIVIVGHPGYFHVHLARLLCRLFRPRARLIYDLFIPLFDAVVEDRRLIARTSRIARWLHAFESSGLRAADCCLIDTEAHRGYVAAEYGIDADRVRVVRVGPTIPDSFASPAPASSDAFFKVLFVGTYIPLHGIPVILEAAHRLRDEKDIRFVLVGTGQTAEEIRRRAGRLGLKNLVFRSWVPVAELGGFIRGHDLGLGIFGATAKARRVIPSKIYDLCAAGLPFITADTPAVRELFTHRRNAYLIPAADPAALADAIRLLRADRPLRERLAVGAFRLGRTRLAAAEAGLQLKAVIDSLAPPGGYPRRT